MRLQITRSELEKMKQHAEQGYPHEVVGILAGQRQSNLVSEVRNLFNERSDTNNRYQVSALALMRAEQELESRGLEIVGYYHSHPDHSSQYSEYDKEHALPNMSYVILSILQGASNTFQSWRLTEDRNLMLEESIEII